ncbi:alpha/beta hydrolase family protein [Bifidobacterium pullorum]|nr:alpha/beta fold hydrolase [Bifidobacterium pullorum]
MELEIIRDGLRLHGLLERPDDGRPHPLVIMCHGFHGDLGRDPASLYSRIARRLVAGGVGVLRFDFNGHGRSDGDFSRMDVCNEIEDLIAVLRHARSRADVTDIRLLGHSQGGVVAGMTAGLYHDVIDRLVLLAPAAALKDDALAGVCMGRRYDPAHIPDLVDVPGAGAVGGHYFRIAQLLPIHEVTARFAGPALAIHGEADTVVDPAASRRYGETMPDCAVRLFPGLDHGIEGEDSEAAIDLAVRFLTV